jgi:hypothetical protein
MSAPGGRFERIGFLKRGPGFTVVVTALFRHRQQLGLDRNTLLVLLSVISHARASTTDYCEAAYSVIVKDTGLHRTIICQCIRILLAPLGTEVTLSKRKKNKDGATARVRETVTGLGLLSLAPRDGSGMSTGSPGNYTWRDGGPRFDTNVYNLGCLADRLLGLMSGSPASAEETPSSVRGFGRPRHDIQGPPGTDSVDPSSGYQDEADDEEDWPPEDRGEEAEPQYEEHE